MNWTGPTNGSMRARKAALHAREQGDIKSMVEQLKTMGKRQHAGGAPHRRLLESA